MNILIIDISFFRKIGMAAYQASCHPVNISTFMDGNMALHHLWVHRHDCDLLPEIIFLNLEIPGLKGWDFLHASDLFFPLIHKQMGIVTTGNPEQPRDRYRAGCHTYVVDVLTKPVYYNYLNSLVQ